MPFTLAHPAAVLPLLRKARPWMSATGLILGSMAPDFEYFLRLRPGGGYGHSLLGLLLLDVPLTLVVVGLFHGIIRKPLVRNMPTFLRNRLGRFNKHAWPISNLWSPRLILGIIIGGLTHIAWDDLTHSRGPVARHFSPLYHPVLEKPLFVWLQYASSLVGILAILLYVWLLPVRPTLPRPAARRQALFWVGVVGSFAVFWPVLTKVSRHWQPVNFFTASVVTSITAGALALLVTSALLRFTRLEVPSSEESA